ncbi:MAG: hypothetical protein VW268_05530 [Rhodospirillaceae bacterium]
MAKKRSLVGSLIKGLIILAIILGIAAGGLALLYPDYTLASQLRSAGVPEKHIAQVIEIKHKIKGKVGMGGGDMMFAARSVWWDLRDAFDLDLTSSARINLPPVLHVTQQSSKPMPGDPKEPAAAEPMEKPVEVQPMAEAPTAPEPKPEMAAPAEPAPAMAAEPAKPEAPADPMKAQMPAAEKPAEPAKEVAAQPAEPMPAATAKPMDLTQPTPESKPVPPAADLTYKRAIDLYSKAKTETDKAEVAKLFAQSAIDGHPGAQYSIGTMHYNGTGVAQDYAKAAEWFGRAAEKGNPAAQFNLGFLYYNGQGVPKDDKLAYKWISAAAENGDKKAIVARDALKQALPASVTKPEETAFPAATTAPAAPGASIPALPAPVAPKGK